MARGLRLLLVSAAALVLSCSGDDYACTNPAVPDAHASYSCDASCKSQGYGKGSNKKEWNATTFGSFCYAGGDPAKYGANGATRCITLAPLCESARAEVF